MFIGILILIYSIGPLVLVEYWYINVSFIVTGLFIAYFSYRYKRNKIFLILDTKVKQEIYSEEFEFNPIEKNKLTKDYKMWLLRGDNVDRIKQILKRPNPFFEIGFCLFCILCTPAIIIISMMGIMYVSSQYHGLIFIFFMFLTIITYLIFRIISINKGYKNIDSEINQILFEEETGYKPLDNRKFTLRYKVWLKLQYYKNR